MGFSFVSQLVELPEFPQPPQALQMLLSCPDINRIVLSRLPYLNWIVSRLI